MYRLKTHIIFQFMLIVWVSGSVLTLYGNEQQQQIDSLSQLVKTIKGDREKVNALVLLSQTYSSYDFKSSISVAERALELAKENGDLELISFALFNAGNAHFMGGMNETAVNYFYSYLDIQKQSNHTQGIAYALASIGALQIKIEDFEAAKNNLLKGLNILNKEQKTENTGNSHQKLPHILNNLGIVYQNLQQYDSALWYYQQSIEAAASATDPGHLQASTYNNIGGLFLDTNELDSAYAPLAKAMQVRQERNDLAGQAASYNRLGEYYLLISDSEKALSNFHSGMAIAKRIGSTELQNSFAQKLFAYYKQAGDAVSALEYLEKLNKLTQTLNNEETIKELTRLELLSAFKERQKIARIEQERLNTIYLFTALLLILLLLIFVLAYFLMHSRVGRLKLEKHNLELSS